MKLKKITEAKEKPLPKQRLFLFAIIENRAYYIVRFT